jgi:hypothetical protein
MIFTFVTIFAILAAAAVFVRGLHAVTAHIAYDALMVLSKREGHLAEERAWSRACAIADVTVAIALLSLMLTLAIWSMGGKA